ncbi:MAG: DUF1292 domain-containing protein [Lachnospiraceae bacterium]|jgi:hypothetical protein|nr:DUF1292 domain-containing protein [Lachnospiraceae bacterium]
MEKITFTPDGADGPVEFYVLDQATLRGCDYILVTDSEEGDGEALILKDRAPADAADSLYEIVDDDTELKAVSELFRDTLEDLGIDLEW